mmetsp:Transcript_14167/g.20774  ORF Transcript_14167/g.20774 Transcript_14167/m.20774 type:complete len:85 (-) Transcript_14167:39-293(-)
MECISLFTLKFSFLLQQNVDSTGSVKVMVSIEGEKMRVLPSKEGRRERWAERKSRACRLSIKFTTLIFSIVVILCAHLKELIRE